MEGCSRLLRLNLMLGAGRDVRLAAWLLAALAAAFLAYVARMHEITHDAFHEMALFREALIAGELPMRDVFAFTPTVDPSVHHEWGTGAILYFATVGSGLGVAGLMVLKLALMAGLWLLLYRVARMRGAHPFVFATCSCLVFPVLWVGFATVRAQLFTLVFIAAQLYMQELDWRGRRAWILAWLVMLVVWLNLHAGFVVGLGLIALHSLERFCGSAVRYRSFRHAIGETWHLILAAPAAVCVLQVNPYGWQYLPYLVRAVTMPRPLIREWQPLWHSYAPLSTLSLFVIAVVLYVYTQRVTSTRRLRGSAFLALAAYMACKHIRHGSIFAVVWIAYVPAWISRTALGKWWVAVLEGNRASTTRICQCVIVASLGFACFHRFWQPTLPPRPVYSTASFPTAAVGYLKETGFSGNLFTPFHVGAYVSWELYPRVQVSFDGRYEVAYQEQVMDEHNRVLGGEGAWWEVLERYPTDAVLVHRQAPVYSQFDRFRLDTPPAANSQDGLGWQMVYEDDSFAILAKPESGLPVLDRRGEPLADGAREAFTVEHGHWSRRRTRELANR